jgi:hypothetical protein
MVWPLTRHGFDVMATQTGQARFIFTSIGGPLLSV